MTFSVHEGARSVSVVPGIYAAFISNSLYSVDLELDVELNHANVLIKSTGKKVYRLIIMRLS